MKHVLIALAATLVLTPGAVIARDLPDGGMTLEEIGAWLQADGMPAEVKTDKDGERYIDSAADGYGFQIYVYDCKDARCGSFQFAAGFDTKGAFGPTALNDWNRSNRWTRGYSDKVNDPWIEYDIDLTPGGTYELLDDQLGIWKSAMGRFRKFIKMG